MPKRDGDDNIVKEGGERAMGQASDGLNGYGSAFPPEPDDGTVEPDGTNWTDYAGIGLALLVIVGVIVVVVRIAVGVLT